MSFSLAFIWLLALVLGAIVYMRGDNRQNQAFAFALSQAIVLLPRIILALMTATLISTMIPPDTIAAWVGSDSGFTGMLISVATGAIIPGGPVVAFPIAVMLKASGAGIPQIIAFITAWSVFAVHRILLFELTMVGWRFTVLRLAVCLPVPLIAGSISQQLMLRAGL